MPGERTAAHAQRREDVAGTGGVDAPVDGRAHAAQRLGHAPHRPPRQRGVADQLGLERAARRAGPSAGGSSCPSCRSRAPRPPPVRPAKPTPWTRASSPASAISTPSARSAAAVDRLSPPRPRPRASTAPSASAPNSSARCEIDLSPGTRQLPRSGPDRRTLQRRCLCRHRCFTITSRLVTADSSRAPATRRAACPPAPRACSAPMCRRTWTRDALAAPASARRTRREARAACTICCSRVARARRRVQIEAAVAACPAPSNSASAIQIQVVAQVQPRADPPQPVAARSNMPRRARAHPVGRPRSRP